MKGGRTGGVYKVIDFGRIGERSYCHTCKEPGRSKTYTGPQA